MPYRRYSDAFAMPTYPDSYPGDQQENHHSRQGNTGRVMRSYSMEYGSYPSARQVRSQSMEGVQLFASAPPMEYSPSLSRSNSAGVVFDWSRGNMDTAPPLPPDVRPLGSNGASHFPSPPPEAYYDVEFKRGRQEVFAGRATYEPGDYVKVYNPVPVASATMFLALTRSLVVHTGGSGSRRRYWAYCAPRNRCVEGVSCE